MKAPVPPGPDPGATAATDRQALRHWAHDLRQALAGLNDHLRLIDLGAPPARGQAHLEAARLQLDSLGRMLATAFAQIGGEALAPAGTDLDALVAALDSIYGPLSQGRLTIRRDPALPRHLALDRISLERILRNLIGNALRHAGARRIEVGLAPHGPAQIALSVVDDGGGFTPAQLTAFAKGPSPNRFAPGPGLQPGLEIVAALAAGLGGRMTVDNAAGGGARVRVVLAGAATVPAPAATPSQAAGRPAGAAGALAGRRILVCDAEADRRAAVVELCREAGADVVATPTATEAMARLAQGPLDLLVVDASLPDGPGAKVIVALRQSPQGGAETPALALSSDISTSRFDELIAAGANRVLSKPMPNAPELLRILLRLCAAAGPARAAGGQGALPPQPSPPADAAPAPPVAAQDSAPKAGAAAEPLFDPAPLTQVCALAGDEMAREILARLPQDLEDTMRRLGRAAAPLDLAELRAGCHVLIALAGTAGALRLLGRAQELNRRLNAPVPGDLDPALAEIRFLIQGAVAAIHRLGERLGQGPGGDDQP